MMLLEDKGGRPDKNEPDIRLKKGEMCIIYGLANSVEHLNGKQAFIIDKVTRCGNIFYPVNETWFACSLYGVPGTLYLREDHLTVLDDSDALVIDKLMIER